jgi:hypothetical protein
MLDKLSQNRDMQKRRRRQMMGAGEKVYRELRDKNGSGQAGVKDIIISAIQKPATPTVNKLNLTSISSRMCLARVVYLSSMSTLVCA